MPLMKLRNGGIWKNISDMYLRNGGVWKNVSSAYIRTGGVWKLFFNGLPYPRVLTYPKVRNASSENINNTTVVSRIGSILYGYNGTWKNNPTGYQRRWRWSTTEEGTLQNFSPTQTSSTLNTSGHVDDWDNRYVVFEVNALNSYGESGWTTSSNVAHLIKYAPFITVSLTGIWEVGETLTAVVTSEDTTDVLNDTSPDSLSFEWFRYDPIFEEYAYNNSNQDTLLLDASDVGYPILVKVTAINSGGETIVEDFGVGDTVQYRPQPFNTISFVKNRLGAHVANKRRLELTWQESQYAEVYEVRYEGSNDNYNWTILQYFTNAPFLYETLDTYDAANYNYYRASVRASDSNYNTERARYSDGGTSTALVYIYATGVAPSKPTIGSPIDVTGNSASIPYNMPSDNGSGSSSVVQFSLNNSTWVNATASTYHTFSLLYSATAYTFYIRALNSDGVYSPTPNNSGNFTTIKNSPENTVSPTISGSYRSFTLTSVGTWNNDPTSYTYQWRYNNGQGPVWNNIPGATGTSVSISDSSYDTYSIKCYVTASNDSPVGSGGYSTATSNTLTIDAPPPVITYGDCVVYLTQCTSSCSGTTRVESCDSFYRKAKYSDGVFVDYVYNCILPTNTSTNYANECIVCNIGDPHKGCSSTDIADGCCLNPSGPCGGRGPISAYC